MKIQSNLDQLDFAELIHLRLAKLPYFWCRFSKHYTSILRSYANEDFMAENFKHLYRMTYQYKLKDDARWTWRMFAYMHGVMIDTIAEEQSEIAKKYRRGFTHRRIQPRRLFGEITNQVHNPN